MTKSGYVVEHKNVKDNRIYLDDNDIYIREYETHNKYGYYISFDKLNQIQRDNESYKNDNKYYISYQFFWNRHDNELFLKKLNAIGGMIFTFKNVYMKENPFDCEYIKKNSTYIVLKSGGTELFETLSGRGYSIYALFYACLTDYNLVEYIEKNNKQLCKDITKEGYMVMYKTKIDDKLSEYFYKDVSNMITDYLVINYTI
jgi:hypothetical protein